MAGVRVTLSDGERVESISDEEGSSSRRGAHVVEMQRRRLLLAFTEVLAENGLEDTRAGRVCQRARMSRRTFYELFEDREACFLGVLDDALARISQKLAPVVEHAGSWQERVRRALTVLLELFDAQPALARVLLGETIKAEAAVLEYRRRVLDELAEIVDEGRSERRRGDALVPLTAESVVGGTMAVVHTCLYEDGHRPLVELVNPLMSMIVLPYLGPAAARKELERPVSRSMLPHNGAHAPASAADPFKDLSIRITFRTARVLATVAAQPGASNRQIGQASGVQDQGQISKLLSRLARNGLLQNSGQGHPKGEANAWTLTEQGYAVQAAIES